MIKFLEMREKLKTTRYAALCLYGNDGWVKRRALANLCEFYGVADDGFGIDRPETSTPENLTLACMTPNMFGGVKLVVCEQPYFPEKKDDAFGDKAKAANKKISEKTDELRKQLQRLVSQADGSFCLVFLADSDKNFAGIDGLETVDCNRLDRSSVVQWIVSYARRQGVTIDRLCADRIAAYCLCDMSRVAVETQKLIDHGDVTLEAVETLVHKDAEYAVYDLSSAIAAKNAARAMDIYRELCSRGEEPRALFALIYNFYRRVYYVKTSSFTDGEIASYLGVKPASVSFARETADGYKAMQLKRALDCLAVADARLKAFVDDGEVMNILIMQLISL